ncbi:MAG: hypothetical protein GXP13_05735 [Gammaproteobacteria bacterium]|nr:hypothetical protein [Gammaproteobacteria bacterium]
MPANYYLILAGILFLPCLPANAEQTETTHEEVSDELLEFLGQWEKVDGEWIDPTQLQEISMLEQKSMKGDSDDQ